MTRLVDDIPGFISVIVRQADMTQLTPLPTLTLGFQLSKPAVLDSDSEHEDAPPKDPTSEREIENMRLRMEAQKLEAQRTGELDKLQQKQSSHLSARRRRERGLWVPVVLVAVVGHRLTYRRRRDADETPAGETWEMG